VISAASVRSAFSAISGRPQEHSSGEIRRLGRITKQGDTAIRRSWFTVLARSLKVKTPDRLRTWALKLEQSRGHNKATVALASKLAHRLGTPSPN
jgi:transposase